jgi:SPP1 family phage portal protein
LGEIIIKTYQDLLAVGNAQKDITEFILSAISEHKRSEEYLIAVDADLYYRHRNPTIMRYQKFVYDQFGKRIPDVWSANNKLASNWYNYFVVQGISYLLGNGVTFKEKSTKDRLGKDFDKKIQDAATEAKNGGVSFGFWNSDHLEVFSLREFVPLYDETTGALCAGIRFWQIDSGKPLRATLYEADGYTEYIKRRDEDMAVFAEKAFYRQIGRVSEAEGETILYGENYPAFPIVPFRNINRQSELVGNQGTIDAYDLMASGLINNVSDGEFIYWVLKNCNAMNEDDDVRFLDQLRKTHVAHADGDDGVGVDTHSVNVPFEASAEALDRLKDQLFRDFMGLTVDVVSAGEVTATQIEAAYEPINQKTDLFEYQVTEFILGILALAGVDDEPTYTRSQMSNRAESVEVVLSAGDYLDSEYITTKLLTILGDADKVEEVLTRKRAEELTRFAGTSGIEQGDGVIDG